MVPDLRSQTCCSVLNQAGKRTWRSGWIFVYDLPKRRLNDGKKSVTWEMLRHNKRRRDGDCLFSGAALLDYAYVLHVSHYKASSI